ncbi:MAG: cobyric acid synthase CobQ [Cyanobacteria bacterium P01_D01_bin.73]
MEVILTIGTGSGCGKSLVSTALCRLLRRQGCNVAPFQAEAATAVTYMAESGSTVAYSQAIQSWAAGTVPNHRFNPVLRTRRKGQQSVCINGRCNDQMDLNTPAGIAEFRAAAWQAVEQSLAVLRPKYDVLVADGMDSPNDGLLLGWDFANIELSRALKAPMLLVVDAGNNGWLGSAVGTLELMEPEDRSRVVAIALNKYRGGQDQLATGIKWLEERIGVPVIGAIPWLKDLLPSAESIDLFARRQRSSDTETRVGVVHLPHMSHFSDLDSLATESTVRVEYIGLDEDLGYPDAIVLPRSRDPKADLKALHKSGMGDQLSHYAAAGGTILGLCDGFQMLGKSVVYFNGLEGNSEEIPGLNLLSINTIVTGEMIEQERLVTSLHPQVGLPVSGKEIRCGYVHLLDSDSLEYLFDDEKLGVVGPNRLIWGTYVPQLFDSGPWRRAWLNQLRQQRGLGSLPTGVPDYIDHREIMLDSVTDRVSGYLDFSKLPIMSLTPAKV